jgi:hypothetical protein
VLYAPKRPSRFDGRFAAEEAGTLGLHRKNGPQLVELVQEPVDQTSWMQNPGARTAHQLDCGIHHRVPDPSMMIFHDTCSSKREAES